jgi:hypothetical protein
LPRIVDLIKKGMFCFTVGRADAKVRPIIFSTAFIRSPYGVRGSGFVIDVAGYRAGEGKLHFSRLSVSIEPTFFLSFMYIFDYFIF